MRHQHKLLPPVRLQYAINLLTHLFFLQRFAGDPEAHGHDFHRDDTQLSVGPICLVFQIQLGQEIHIRVESDADTVDKQDREPGFGGVWTVPVGESFRGGAMGGEKSKGAEWEDHGKSEERGSMEVEGLVVHAARSYCVDDKHTLQNEVELAK